MVIFIFMLANFYLKIMYNLSRKFKKNNKHQYLVDFFNLIGCDGFSNNTLKKIGNNMFTSKILNTKQ